MRSNKVAYICRHILDVGLPKLGAHGFSVVPMSTKQQTMNIFIRTVVWSVKKKPVGRPTSFPT